MARYKLIDTNPRLIPVNLAAQLLPGTFEHAVDHLLEQAIDLSRFDVRYRNDTTGAPAYPPAVLLKVVLCAYARGIVSGRVIARLCEDHVTFIALCGARTPHFTTIAAFVSSLGADIAPAFAAVLAVCDQQGLIGREMFAIDGVKLPSNASKRRSGTRADFERQAAKLEAAAATMLARHRTADTTEEGPRPDPPDGGGSAGSREATRLARLERDAAQLRTWLATHPDDRRSAKGAVRLSNRTDADSAKLATGKGVIQGYTAVAAVDARAQIIVDAQAHGTGAETELLVPVLDAVEAYATPGTLITADAGYHSEANLRTLAARQRSALIADRDMRRRDARFATQGRHKPAREVLHDKRPQEAPKRYQPSDFAYDPIARTYVCPAGKSLNRKGRDLVVKGFRGAQFRGAKRDCVLCAHRGRCLRTPDKTETRQVMFFEGRAPTAVETHTQQMQRRLDTPHGRVVYGRRFATVEPVFANLRHNKWLDRFTLRGREKVDGQWKLFCLVHNIEKLVNAGFAA
ncbi:MAG: transposase [Gemmatimonadaceae bacterium]|nr:transposase [Gemmatimonadaceae bacterium]